MLPARFAPALTSLILSGLMSCIVTFIAAVRSFGMGDQTIEAWINAWMMGWPIAFAVVLIASPPVRKIVAKIVAQPRKG